MCAIIIAVAMNAIVDVNCTALLHPSSAHRRHTVVFTAAGELSRHVSCAKFAGRTSHARVMRVELFTKQTIKQQTNNFLSRKKRGNVPMNKMT